MRQRLLRSVPFRWCFREKERENPAKIAKRSEDVRGELPGGQPTGAVRRRRDPVGVPLRHDRGRPAGEWRWRGVDGAPKVCHLQLQDQHQRPKARVRRRVNPSEPIIDCMHVYTYRSIDGSTGSARPLRSGSDSDRRLRCSFSILCVVGFNLFFSALITFHFFC